MSQIHLHHVRLAPFGNHRDTVLEFAAPGALTVIYGPNGAGKSTLRRAIHHLLFGIPQGRLEDDYRHARRDLRIESELEVDGVRRHLARVAGLKNSLRDMADGDKIVPPEWLAEALSMEREVYTSRFCLDHEALRAGGDELLHAPPGEVASLGLSTLKSLRQLEQQLGGDAAELFKPNASKPALNAALAQYRTLEKQLRQASLSAADWAAQQKRVAELMQQLERQNRDYAELRGEHERLARIKAAKMPLAQYQDVLARLESLRNVPDLAPDFQQRRIQVLQQGEASEAGLRHETQVLERLRREHDALPLQPEIMASAEAIEACLEGRGSWQQALRALPGAEAELTRAQASRSEAVARAGLNQTDEPAPLPEAWVERLRALAARYADLNDSRDGAREELERAEAALGRIEKAQPAETPAAELRSLLQAAHRDSAGLSADLEALAAAELAAQRCKQRLLEALARLAPHLKADQVPAPRVPTAEVIVEYRARYDELRRREERWADEREEVEQRLHDNTRQREALCEQGAPPSFELLQELRDSRDGVWRGLRASLGLAATTAQPDPLEVGPAAERYERLVAEADQLADRRYAAADSLQRLNQLQHDARSLEDRRRQLGEAQSRLTTERAALDEEWRSLWRASGVQEPSRPAEMAAWRQDYERAVSMHEEVAQVEAEQQRLRARVEQCRKLLAQALGRAGLAVEHEAPAETLRLLLQAQIDVLEERLEAQRRYEKELHACREACASAGRGVEQADRKLAEWCEAWLEALSALGLNPSLDVEQALAQLKALEAFARAHADASRAALDVERLQRVRGAFERDLEALRPLLGADAPSEPDACLQRLKASLEQARDAERDRRRLHQDIEAAERRRSKHEQTARDLQARRQALLVEAGVPEFAELEQVEAKAAEKRRYREQLEQLRQQLFELGDGLTPEELAEAAAAESDDGLVERLEALKGQQEALDARRGETQRDLALAQHRLDEMRSGEAEVLAQQRDAAWLRVRELAERYALRSVAAGLVRRAIEAYAAQHQDPLLVRAGELFQIVTNHAFSTITPDYGEQDQIVHLAVRADGERVPVPRLSDGERDALYLALYVAALEQHLDRGLVLPVVFDDVLINVDDPRSEPLLGLLAQLAQRTQVLLFTHHERIAEQARDSAGAHVCRLINSANGKIEAA